MNDRYYDRFKHGRDVAWRIAAEEERVRKLGVLLGDLERHAAYRRSWAAREIGRLERFGHAAEAAKLRAEDAAEAAAQDAEIADLTRRWEEAKAQRRADSCQR